MHLYIVLTLFFLAGLIIGSFLNALIYRLEIGRGLGGRSFCPKCKKEIKWYDLFPVVSWLVLGGKCRYCKANISDQYPLVELATGFLFAAIGPHFLSGAGLDSGQAGSFFIHFSASTLTVIPAPSSVIPAQAGIQSMLGIFNLLFWLVFAAGLAAIFVYDLKHQIIPNEIIYTLLVLGLVFVGVNTALLGHYQYLIDHLLSGLVAGGFFYILAMISGGKWMGGGDIKLVAFMGLVLGWPGIIVALYAGFILGAVFGAISLVSGQKKLGSKIPFGPFLVTGTFISFFFLVQILAVYGRMFL